MKPQTWIGLCQVRDRLVVSAGFPFDFVFFICHRRHNFERLPSSKYSQLLPSSKYSQLRRCKTLWRTEKKKWISLKILKYAFTIKNSNSPIEEILFLYQLLSSVSLDFFLFAKSMVSSYSTHEKYGQKTCLKNFSCKTCCWLVQILLRNENVLNQSSCLDSWKDCEIENLPHYFFKILSIRLNLYQKCLKSLFLWNFF